MRRRELQVLRLLTRRVIVDVLRVQHICGIAVRNAALSHELLRICVPSTLHWRQVEQSVVILICTVLKKRVNLDSANFRLRLLLRALL